jgi:hypothetical protein
MGGGGGSNPASGMTQAFGQAIGTVGTRLTDWFGQLKGEDITAMNQLNPEISAMLNTAFDPQQRLPRKRCPEPAACSTASDRQRPRSDSVRS